MVTRKKIRMEQLAAKHKRRRRKPMTEEQKKAAAERLAKARAAKKKTNGYSTPHGVHPSVAARPETNVLCLKNVKQWIAHTKDVISQEKQSVKQKVKGAQARLGCAEGYLADMQHYLRTGDWINNFYGKEQGMKTKWVVVAAGPDNDLQPGDIWTIDDIKKTDEKINSRRKGKRA